MTDPKVDDVIVHLTALSLRTMYLLNAFMKVLQEDGVMSMEQIERSVSNAKHGLEAQKNLAAIRAALMLEGLPGGS